MTSIHKALTQNSDWLNTRRPLTPDDLRGRLILADFWTYCCINCIHVIPKLQALEKEFGDKLTVIGVHSAKFENEGESINIRKAIIRYGIHHPVVNDADFRIWNSFGVNAWPSLFLISPEGKILRKYAGEGDLNQMKKDIADGINFYGKNLTATPLPIALEQDKESPTVLKFPSKITVADDVDGAPALFITDSGHNRIVGVRKDGTIFVTVGGGETGFKDGDFTSALFNQPQGTEYRDGKLYIADTANHALRIADLKQKTVITAAGNGTRGSAVLNPLGIDADKAALASPWDVAFYPDDETLIIANAGTHQILSYNITGKTVKPFAGNSRESIEDGVFPLNSMSQTSGLSVYDGKLYFVDSETSSLRVAAGRSVETLIGTGLFDFGMKDGKQGTALMQHPLGLTAAKDGVFIADSYNHAVRLYDYKTKKLSTITKDTGLNEPNDIVPFDGAFLIADTNNHRILKTDDTGKIIGNFDVMPAVKPVEWDNNLPNEAELKPQTVSSGADISFLLKKGWKINRDAPSYLAVFDTKHSIIHAYSREEIVKNNLRLPDLSPDRTYIIQGTLYYCEDKAESLCLIKGITGDFTVSKDKNGGLLIPLNM